MDNAILEVLAHHTSSASIEDIIHSLQITPSRRTLQYHLAQLVKKGLLSAQGKTKNRRYQLSKQIDDTQPSTIPLSKAAESIRIQANKPIQLRIPIGYQKNFLDSYRPNISQYLSDSIKQKLLDVGKSPVIEYPAGTYAKQIFQRLLVDLSWNSSRLEGNTYSRLETERLIELGEETQGREALEAQMILNHKSAIEFMVKSVESIGINRFTVLNLHALLSNNLLANPRSCGRLRMIPVSIGKSVYQPLAIPQVLEFCFQQILDTASAIKNPFEQAFFLLVHLPYLQPFEDVNKRVSRLAANIPLIQANLCPLSFVDVPTELYVSGLLGVYEQNRIELLRDVFVWAYERSCQLYLATRSTIGEPDPFRFRYHRAIGDIIFTIVHEKMDKKTAISSLKRVAAEKITTKDQMHFIEVVESELIGLHEGNMARYGIFPPAYEAWQQVWQSEN